MAKVLIIDDDVHIAGLLRSHLTDEGYDVVVANRGAEGLAEALKSAPDLILLDVMLPDATGFQLCKELRKSPSTQGTPIIMMSGVARYPNQQVFGLERGANEYILKPFQIIEVGELVHSYIRHGHTPPTATPASHRKSAPPKTEVIENISDLRTYLDQAMNRFRI